MSTTKTKDLSDNNKDQTVLQQPVACSTTDKTPKKRTSRTAGKPLSLFESLVQIGTIHENEGGTLETVLPAAGEHLDFVCEKLDITPAQAVLFADTVQ